MQKAGAVCLLLICWGPSGKRYPQAMGSPGPLTEPFLHLTGLLRPPRWERGMECFMWLTSFLKQSSLAEFLDISDHEH